MRILSAADIEASIDLIGLVEALRTAFRTERTAPCGFRYDLPVLGEPPAQLSAEPAWQTSRHIGILIATAFPGNTDKGLPVSMGVYLLCDGRSGKPLALMDGPALIRHRTAATAALGSQYLSREDASRLLVVGTGPMAARLALAHCRVRPIRHILIWGRRPQEARRLARRLSVPGARTEATEDLEGGIRGADIVASATAAREPLLRGEWLQPGVHVDLVGSVTPDMREADDETLRRGRIFVDTLATAPQRSGDLCRPLKEGVISRDDIAGDLAALTQGRRAGRRFYRQITVFKIAGSGIEDLTTAQMVNERA